MSHADEQKKQALAQIVNRDLPDFAKIKRATRKLAEELTEHFRDVLDVGEIRVIDRHDNETRVAVTTSEGNSFIADVYVTQNDGESPAMINVHVTPTALSNLDVHFPSFLVSEFWPKALKVGDVMKELPDVLFHDRKRTSSVAETQQQAERRMIHERLLHLNEDEQLEFVAGVEKKVRRKLTAVFPDWEVKERKVRFGFGMHSFVFDGKKKSNDLLFSVVLDYDLRMRRYDLQWFAGRRNDRTLTRPSLYDKNVAYLGREPNIERAVQELRDELSKITRELPLTASVIGPRAQAQEQIGKHEIPTQEDGVRTTSRRARLIACALFAETDEEALRRQIRTRMLVPGESEADALVKKITDDITWWFDVRDWKLKEKTEKIRRTRPDPRLADTVSEARLLFENKHTNTLRVSVNVMTNNRVDSSSEHPSRTQVTLEAGIWDNPHARAAWPNEPDMRLFFKETEAYMRRRNLLK